MARLLQSISERYHNILAQDKYADLRTKDWFLINNPLALALIMVSYLYFCTVAGPRFMKNRKPYNLKNTIVFYNIVQVLFSCYLVYGGIKVWMTYNWICQPIDYSSAPLNIYIANLCWLYFIAKITEFLDTFFFILRKKYNQVSFLHLFHHSLMPVVSWIGTRYFAGGHGTLFGVINSFVHVIMYGYYAVAALGPEYRKYLWWKKHLTTLQLIQFGTVFLHNFYPLFTDCSYPKGLHYGFLFFSSVFIFLFGNFYVQTYILKPKEKISKKQ